MEANSNHEFVRRTAHLVSPEKISEAVPRKMISTCIGMLFFSLRCRLLTVNRLHMVTLWLMKVALENLHFRQIIINQRNLWGHL